MLLQTLHAAVKLRSQADQPARHNKIDRLTVAHQACMRLTGGSGITAITVIIASTATPAHHESALSAVQVSELTILPAGLCALASGMPAREQ